MNPQLDLYVSAERAKGVSDETIKAGLKTAGWQDADIVDAMKVVVTPMTQTTPWLMYLLWTIIGLGAIVAVWYFIIQNQDQNQGQGPSPEPTQNTGGPVSGPRDYANLNCGAMPSNSDIASLLNARPANLPGSAGNRQSFLPPTAVSGTCGILDYFERNGELFTTSFFVAGNCRAMNKTCPAIYEEKKANLAQTFGVKTITATDAAAGSGKESLYVEGAGDGNILGGTIVLVNDGLFMQVHISGPAAALNAGGLKDQVRQLAELVMQAASK